MRLRSRLAVALRCATRPACALAGALSLAGCYTVDQTVPTTAAIPADYHARHPVVLANTPDILDVFPVGGDGRLDARQARQMQVFAEAYRKTAQGGLVMQVPRGAVDAVAVRRTVDAVRRDLAANGVRGTLRSESYSVDDPSLAAPVRLSFAHLAATVASRCGEWPDDLNSGTSLDGWDNHSYYNLGCASTKTLTAQIDDPRDLVQPRAEDPTDVVLRTRAIGLLRGTPGAGNGRDPGTAWEGSTLTPISTVGNP